MSKKYHTVTEIDRFRIRDMVDLGLTRKEIAERIGCSERTVYYELKRGKTVLLNTELIAHEEYLPDKAHNTVKENISRRGRLLSIDDCDAHRFIDFIQFYILEKRWSPDACIHYAKKLDLGFNCCTRTLYNYINNRIIPEVTNKHLWRKGKLFKSKSEGKYTLDRSSHLKSIVERPLFVADRSQFGHWEMDSVESVKGDRTSLLVLTERKHRFELIFKQKSKSQASVKRTLDNLEKKLGYNKFMKIFKSITTDNGSEFISENNIVEKSIKEGKARTEHYVCHPYSPGERASNENQNAIIRRFAPKGTELRKLDDLDVKSIQDYMNTIPRKILGYRSSWECFADELTFLNVSTAIFS